MVHRHLGTGARRTQSTSNPEHVAPKHEAFSHRRTHAPTHRSTTRMKVGLVSLGCPKNLVDSEVMLGLAREAGHELTQNPGDADVLVVNTCAFIDKAKQESVDTILELARHKETGACRRLIVTGCLAERYRDELKAEIPEIDAVLGTGEVPQIVGAIAGVTAPGVSPLTFFTGGGAPPPPRTDADAIAAASHGRGSARHPGAAAAPGAPAWPQAPQSELPTYIYDADTPRVFA